MIPRWRLILNVAVWAFAIPVFGLVVAMLSQRVFRTNTADTVLAHVMEAVLVVWAFLIYWRCVPHVESVLRRAIYFVFFVAVMVVLGAYALDVAFILVALFFGV